MPMGEGGMRQGGDTHTRMFGMPARCKIEGARNVHEKICRLTAEANLVPQSFYDRLSFSEDRGDYATTN